MTGYARPISGSEPGPEPGATGPFELIDLRKKGGQFGGYLNGVGIKHTRIYIRLDRNKYPFIHPIHKWAAAEKFAALIF